MRSVYAPKERKTSKPGPKKAASKAELLGGEGEGEEDVFGGLDASRTLMVHGIETDWIEEEMSDDDDFRCI